MSCDSVLDTAQQNEAEWQITPPSFVDAARQTVRLLREDLSQYQITFRYYDSSGRFHRGEILFPGVTHSLDLVFDPVVREEGH